jgi:ferric-dicitrate binding protein FerR (iron transport regulator)
MATKLGNWVANVAGILAPEATRQAFQQENGRLKADRRIAFQGARQRATGLQRPPAPGLQYGKPSSDPSKLTWKELALPLAVVAGGLGAVALATKKKG